MKSRYFAFGIVVLVGLAVATSGMAGINFEPGNRGDEPHAGEYKSRGPGTKRPPNPDSWKYMKSEWKRSGLNNVGKGTKNFFASIFDIRKLGSALKNQEERYVARQGSDVK